MANLQAKSCAASAPPPPSNRTSFCNCCFNCSSKTPLTATMPPSSSPSTMTLHAAFATPIAGTFPLCFSGEMAHLSDSTTATVLGLFDKWDCTLEEGQLFPGDTLVLYTDGATESFNDSGEEFGDHRLIESLHNHRALSRLALIYLIVADVLKFNPHEQQDEITLLVGRLR